MRIQNVANKIEALGGKCQIGTSPREDNRHVVRLIGKLGRYDIEAVDYNSPSSMAADADVSVIMYRREDESAESPWLFHRTIGSLEQLVSKNAKGVI
ncbi:hypothetical protein ACGFY9_39895 [Streptomyces sp. NPDC048504]|uniref:hypothetical protein n=1 Tax=Streptomyces sp. NPDC048504 TaxID=3365559 RepID=UPI00372453A5